MPLLPLRAGGGDRVLVADAVIEDGGRRLLRVLWERLGPSTVAPARVELLLGEGKEGVELHGREGDRFARPALLVPNTVRVGMRWRTHVPGQPRTEYEVIARDEHSPPDQPVVVWTIAEFVGASDIPTAQLTLAEGLGIRPTLSPLRAVLLEGSLEDGPIAPALPPSSRTPFVVGPSVYESNYVESDAFSENLYLVNMGLVVPAGAQTGTLIVKGLRSCAFASDDGSGLCIEEMCFDIAATGAGIIQTAPLTEGYFTGSGCAKHYTNSREEITSDASGALVLPSGVHWVPRELNGGLRNATIAPYAHPETGDPRLLVYSQDEIVPQYRALWADYLPEGRNYSPSDEPTLAEQWVAPFFRRLGSSGNTPGLGWTLSAPGESMVRFAAMNSDYILFHSQLEGDLLTPVEPVTTVLGARSTTASEEGQTLLLASPGGRIDRVVAAPDGSLTREALARIDLEEGEQLVAAVDMAPLSPDHLLVATWRAPAPDHKDVQGNLGRVEFFRIEKQPPVSWEWPKGSGVLTTQRALDVVVCWPRSDEPLSREGWLLGGIPPQQIIETKPGSCVLLVRDVDADPVLQGRSMVDVHEDDALNLYNWLRFDVEGPIPGAGRMWLAMSPNGVEALSTTYGVTTMAPLTNGGYASPYRIYGPGALPIALPKVMSHETGGTPDLSGAGIWFVKTSTVRLIGPEPFELTMDGLAPNTSYFADPNGGLVIRDASSWLHIATDAAITELPIALASVDWSARRRTGEVCGNTGYELVCADGVSGSETARAEEENAVPSIIGLFEDDSMLVRVSSDIEGVSFRRWVPGEPTKPWNTDRPVFSFTPTLDGKVWCVVHQDGDPYEPYRPGYCTPDGFEPVDLWSELSKRSWMAANYFKDIYQVVEGRDELWIQTYGCLNGCFSRWERIPWP